MAEETGMLEQIARGFEYFGGTDVMSFAKNMDLGILAGQSAIAVTVVVFFVDMLARTIGGTGGPIRRSLSSRLAEAWLTRSPIQGR